MYKAQEVRKQEDLGKKKIGMRVEFDKLQDILAMNCNLYPVVTTSFLIGYVINVRLSFPFLYVTVFISYVLSSNERRFELYEIE